MIFLFGPLAIDPGLACDAHRSTVTKIAVLPLSAFLQTAPVESVLKLRYFDVCQPDVQKSALFNFNYTNLAQQELQKLFRAVIAFLRH